MQDVNKKSTENFKNLQVYITLKGVYIYKMLATVCIVYFYKEKDEFGFHAFP